MKRAKIYPISAQEIYLHGKKIVDSRARSLYYLLYIAGARVSELKSFTRYDVIHEDEEKVRLRIATLKKRMSIAPRRVVTVPLAGARCHEREMWEDIKEFLAKLEPEERPFAVWRNMSEWISRQVPPLKVLALLPSGTEAVVEKRFNPHFLRHCRATHLAEVYRATEHQMRAFFGWADARPASTYVQIRDVDAIFFE